MPRIDQNGRQLKALLDYIFDGDVEAREIYGALGTSSSTYYRRIKEADYPNAEELRLVADHFRLSYPDLQVRFGLMSHDDVINYIQSAPLAVATAAPAVPTRATKLSEMTRRADAPPL
ncbi:XRE family transcriptional regulator [Mycobacterium sp. SMC-16]|uniref:XRE family transcriptional regulator n=1 Tax=Mycobacteriaceae TaxID=1762 RepID=UPI00226A6D99|nr:XRE family transcriptional regulator [Mycolicibacterium mucogenicum]MCX8558641.1 XRE family transcriptional regulator [Mycolicibacterium mucogenicum]